MKQKQAVVFVIGAVLIGAWGLLGRRTDTDALASNRLLDAVKEARRRCATKRTAALRDAERFIADLKQIDASKAPMNVQAAFRKYIEAVENDAHVRRNHGNTNEADAEWHRAQTALGMAVSRHATTAF